MLCVLFCDAQCAQFYSHNAIGNKISHDHFTNSAEQIISFGNFSLKHMLITRKAMQELSHLRHCWAPVFDWWFVVCHMSNFNFFLVNDACHADTCYNYSQSADF